MNTDNDHDTPTTTDDLATSMKLGAKQFQRFKVIQADERDDFERIINEHLQAGWTLHGDPVYRIYSNRIRRMDEIVEYAQSLKRWNDEEITADDLLGPTMKP